MKRKFEALGLRWSKTKERGATAVVIGLTFLLVVGAAALSFDTANLALQRQTLRNITDAAAQAGASYLPGNPTAAINAAFEYAHKYDSTLTPTVTLWCIVGSTGATKQVGPGFIPATCNPGGSGTYVNGVGGVICDEYLCAIPCNPAAGGARCNTVKVESQKNVPYYFAPAIGINSGSTGAVTSVSCRGACGTLLPNAMDVAFVADRTSSLTSSDFSAMRTGIADTLATMTPEYQLATIGTIHKSTGKSGCDTYIAANSSNPTPNGGARQGSWMPTQFSNTYLTGTLGSASRTLNTSDTLVKDVNCMNQASQPWGTHLAAPLKSAARMLLGYDSSNLSTLSASRAKILPDGATVHKVIIMETDGIPEESIGFNGYLVGNSGTYYRDSNTSLGSTSLNNSSDPVSGSPWNGDIGCDNLEQVAANAKAAGITVIMIGYGQANTARCKKNYSNGTYSGTPVKDVLAAAASNAPDGSPSAANYDCTKSAGAAAENADGDNYFCAADGSQLASIFLTAFSQISTYTKFVKMPS